MGTGVLAPSVPSSACCCFEACPPTRSHWDMARRGGDECCVPQNTPPQNNPHHLLPTAWPHCARVYGMYTPVHSGVTPDGKSAGPADQPAHGGPPTDPPGTAAYAPGAHPPRGIGFSEGGSPPFPTTPTATEVAAHARWAHHPQAPAAYAMTTHGLWPRAPGPMTRAPPVPRASAALWPRRAGPRLRLGQACGGSRGSRARPYVSRFAQPRPKKVCRCGSLPNSGLAWGGGMGQSWGALWCLTPRPPPPRPAPLIVAPPMPLAEPLMSRASGGGLGGPEWPPSVERWALSSLQMGAPPPPQRGGPARYERQEAPSHALRPDDPYGSPSLCPVVPPPPPPHAHNRTSGTHAPPAPVLRSARWQWSPRSSTR